MQVDAVVMARYRAIMEGAADAKREADEAVKSAVYIQSKRAGDYDAARERYIAYLEGQATIVEGA